MRSSGDETVMKLRGKSQPIRSSPCVACGNPPVPVSKKEILNTSLENVTGFMSLCSVSLLKQ